MPSRRTLSRVAVAVIALIAIAPTTVLLRGRPDVGHWRSTGTLADYRAAHAELLATLPVAPERLDVPIDHGVVHALHWPGDGVPVLLIPGRSSGSSQWVENLPGWIGNRPLYALDPLGDAGFSTQRLPLGGPEEQADAYVEVLDELDITRAHVVGHSFGGAQAAMVATRYPDRVASLALMEPVFVISPLPAATFFWAAVSTLPVPTSWRDRALAKIGGTTVEEVRADSPMARMIDVASQGYSAQLPMPRTLDDEQWRALDMPVRLDLGGRQSLSGADAADRIRVLLPDATVTVWPDGTHSLPMDHHTEFDRLLPEFWDTADTP